VDGQKHADQMRAVGLFGGAERLPGVAFNTKDARQLPFSEKLPINRDTLLQFVASFLSGKLGSKADAEAAAKLALTNPGLNMKNLPTGRKPRKKAPPERKGDYYAHSARFEMGGRLTQFDLASFHELKMP